MELKEELVVELVKDIKTQEDLATLMRSLRKRGIEAALSGELTDHLGYEKHERSLGRRGE
jgi:transposase-like protein